MYSVPISYRVYLNSSAEEALEVVLHGNGDSMSDDDDGHGDEEQQQDEIEQRASQSQRRLTAVAAH